MIPEFFAVILIFGAGPAVATRWMTGWGALERRYRDKNGKAKRRISQGSFRWVGCRPRFGVIGVAIELYPDGLWLRTGFPFTLLLRPVLIPWRCLAVTRQFKVSMLSTTTFSVADVPFRLGIGGRAGQRIAQFLDAHQTIKFNKLNEDWNAEPNSPDPRVTVRGEDVDLGFAVITPPVDPYGEERRARLRFKRVVRYRLGATNDEGWYRGQCRFSQLAPAWGQFYEVSGDADLLSAPADWVELTGACLGTEKHYLFYFRDNTFECVAQDVEIDLYQDGKNKSQEGAVHIAEDNFIEVDRTLRGACACSGCPAEVRIDGAVRKLYAEYKALASTDWRVLLRCPACGQLWSVDEWDKYHVQLAIKLPDIAQWTQDDSARRKAFLLRSRGGYDTGNCFWEGWVMPPEIRRW